MTEREKEQRQKERLKANYEAYIQRLKAKPAPGLIKIASEIAAAKFIYRELEMEDAFSEYADALLQFENPLEALQDYWLGEQACDHHEELIHLLWNMTGKGIGVGGRSMTEEAPTGPSMEQGVGMC